MTLEFQVCTSETKSFVRLWESKIHPSSFIQKHKMLSPQDSKVGPKTSLCDHRESHRKFSMVSRFSLDDREEEALSAEAL